jgi:Putative adhesin
MSEMHGTVTHEAGAYEGGAHDAPPRLPGGGRAALPLTPARRVALLIGVPVCLALTGYAGLTIVAQVAKGRIPFNHVFPADARQLSVSLGGGGNAVLEQVSAGPARLSGYGYYSFVRPTITERTSADSAAVGYPCSTFPIGTCSMNATLSVPAGTAVTISTSGGDLTADHLAGDLTLDTDGGNIQATAITATRLSADTGGGDVTVDHVEGDLSLHTDGGNIQATGVAATRLAATSGGGDIEIVLTVVPRDVTVSTDGGNVTIVVPPGSTRYNVSASTDGGNVTDTIPHSASSLDEITATSGGGDITIEQSAT